MSYIVINSADDGSIGTLRYGIETGEFLITIDSDLVPTINIENTLELYVSTEIVATGTTVLIGSNTISTGPAYMFEIFESLIIRNVTITSALENNCGFRIEQRGNLTMDNCLMENLGSLDSSVSNGVCISVRTGENETNEIIISDCIFRNNRSAHGGAVLWSMLDYFSNFILTMTNVVDENNGGALSGGSIYITQTTYPEPRNMNITMTECRVSNSMGSEYGGYLIQPMNSTNLVLSINNSLFDDALLEINVTGDDAGVPLPDISSIDINVIESTLNARGLSFNCSNASGTVEASIKLTDTGFYDNAYFITAVSDVSSNITNVNVERCSFVGTMFGALHLETIVANSTIISSIQNSTFANSSGRGIYIQSINSGQVIVTGRNLTINNNGTGVQLDTENNGVGDITLYNSIVAGNISNYIENNNAGMPSYTTFSCIVDATDLNIRNLANNGGFTPTMAIDQTSTAFNTGDNSFVLAATDQRGFPRIAYGTVDIGAYEFQEPFVVCLRGDARVLVDGRYIPIESVKTGDSVFDLHSKRYVPVLHNIVTEKVRKFAYIKEGSVTDHVPHEDLYITEGHIVNIDGKHVKAKDVPGVEIVHCEPQIVYSIVTKNAIFIDINGLPVYTWSAEKWENKSQNHKAWKAQ